MRIDFVAAGPDRAGRYTVRFEDGTSMRLYRQSIEDFGIYAGKTLEEGEYARLQQEAAKMSARMRAVRIISASSVSKQDLQQRLVHKGEDPQQAKDAVAWLSELDLVDDRKTAEQVVQRCISKGYGLARAKQALYEKRIPKAYWDEALADYPDQIDTILSYLRHHLSNDGDERQLRRVIDALIRRGHSYSQVRRALDMLSVDHDFPEET